VSIGRRLIDLARAELNSLLDRAARAEEDDDFGSPTDHMSDKELEEELERRRQARQEAEHAAGGTRASYGGDRLDDRPPRAGVNNSTSGQRSSSTGSSGSNSQRSSSGAGSSSTGSGSRRRPEFRRAGSDDGNAVRRAYAALEVPPGSDFETVRRAYRAMMRKYHPDLHTSTPEKQKAANEIAQRLTDSYKLLEKRLRK
jgi:DnaJ-domain-containing protein 1